MGGDSERWPRPSWEAPKFSGRERVAAGTRVESAEMEQSRQIQVHFGTRCT